MALRRKVCRLVAVGLVIGAIVLIGGGWIACEQGIHPEREEERWPEIEKFPRYTLRQFGLPCPENVHFRSVDGLVLAGWFIRGTNGATVILVHGKDASRAEMLPHANYLYRGGFSVLMFDSRHRGRSEGGAVTLGAKEPLDIMAAVDYLKTRSDIASERIGVQGISLGGVSGILAAAERAEIKGIVAESAFESLTSAIADGIKHITGLPGFPFAPVAKFICELRLGTDLDGVAPVDAIGKISTRPVLLIHDREDKQLTEESARRLFAAAGEPKELWLIAGAEHGKGWQHSPDEYEVRVLAFWRKTLKG